MKEYHDASSSMKVVVNETLLERLTTSARGEARPYHPPVPSGVGSANATTFMKGRIYFKRSADNAHVRLCVLRACLEATQRQKS
jgi:hypothetical protein